MKQSDQIFRLMWLSRPLMQRVERLVRLGLEGTGVSVRMRAVLEILDEKGPLTVPDLAHDLQIQRQYVQVMVNEVLAEGLMERKPNPRHRSSQLIALTPLGQGIISKVIARERQTAELMAEEFSDDEIAIALGVTERLCDRIDAHIGNHPLNKTQTSDQNDET